MSLLDLISSTSLEPGYHRAALARQGAARDGHVPRSAAARGVAGPGPLVLLLVAGLLLATAAVQAGRDAPTTAATRDALVSQVVSRTGDTDALAARVAEVQAGLSAAQDAALQRATDDQRLSQRISELELVTGAAAVTGPGLRVVLDDAPAEAEDPLAGGGGTAGTAVPQGRLLDRDLTDVANALWAAGAEAVAVNGQRLTAQTAISSAGDSLLVDFRPLSPPYEILAVGDPGQLEPAFVDSATGRRFSTYVSLLGIEFSVTAEDELSLPGGVLRGAGSIAGTGGGPA